MHYTGYGSPISCLNLTFYKSGAFTSTLHAYYEVKFKKKHPIASWRAEISKVTFTTDRCQMSNSYQLS
jgi:hypothetical protein